jgi:hypothetical protein
MSADGKSTLAALRQIREFCSEASKMLLEADARMHDAAWKERSGSVATAGNAFSIHSPRNWIPSKLFRFYRRDASSGIIPCISVILESEDRTLRLDEPLVAGTVVEYEANDLPVGVQLYAISTWHLWVPDRKDDGSLHRVVPMKLWPGETTAKQMTSFALPLVSVRDRTSLRDLVIAPMLNILGERDSMPA